METSIGYPTLAAELVALKVDVLVTHAEGAFAAKRATTSIPIVMAFSADAVATGVVASLARPGGNVTGSTVLIPEISAKRLELLKAAAPRITRVAFSSGRAVRGKRYFKRCRAMARQ